MIGVTIYGIIGVCVFIWNLRRLYIIVNSKKVKAIVSDAEYQNRRNNLLL